MMEWERSDEELEERLPISGDPTEREQPAAERQERDQPTADADAVERQSPDERIPE